MGKALSDLFIKENHRVSIVGRHIPSTSERRRDPAHYWKADLDNLRSLTGILNRMGKEYGKISNLVFFQRYRGQSDDWDGELKTTLTATKVVIDHLIPRFDRDAGGSIVMVSSLASRFVTPNQPASYHVAKAGLVQLAAYYAVTLGPKNIRVNCISPGTTVKEESKTYYQSKPKLLNMYKRIVPLARLGTSEDVANAIALLCDPKASFITGQNIAVDGGLSLLLQDTLARRLTVH